MINYVMARQAPCCTVLECTRARIDAGYVRARVLSQCVSGPWSVVEVEED